MLATLTGNYKGSYSFDRGVFGKYLPTFSTQVGICAPKQCTVDNVTDAYMPLLRRYAEEAYWTEPEV